MTYISRMAGSRGYAIPVIMVTMVVIFIVLGVALDYSYTLESQEVKLSYDRMQSYWAMVGTLDYMLARCRMEKQNYVSPSVVPCKDFHSFAMNNYQNDIQLFPPASVDISTDNTIKFNNPSTAPLNALFLPLTVEIAITPDPMYSATATPFSISVTSWTRT